MGRSAASHGRDTTRDSDGDPRLSVRSLYRSGHRSPHRAQLRARRTRRAGRQARGALWFGQERAVKLPAEATIYEVGPRDGLQNEARQVPTSDKIRFIDALVAAGIRGIEITSFVSPKWVPQLADAARGSRGAARPPGVRESALGSKP